MAVVRSPVRSCVRSPVSGVFGGVASLLNDATSYLGGVEPYHYADYINNRMLYAGADVGTVAGGTGYSFTRASEGYYTNSDGTLTNFASGALRRGDRGVLIEGARTNLNLQSQTLDNAAWTPTDATITANATTAPDDTLTADKLVESATTAQHFIQPTSTYAATTTPGTASFFAKAGERSVLRVYCFACNNLTFFVNLTTGAVTNQSGGTSAVVTTKELGSGWWRIVFSDTLTNTNMRWATSVIQTAGTSSYAGDGTSGIYLWGYQFEQAGFVSSYIPTTSSSATRAGSEYLTATTSGLDSAVSMWSEVEFGATTSAVQTIAQFDDGTANNRLILRRNASGNAEMELITGGASQGIVTGGAMANNTTHKIACSATANALRLSLNGTSATPDTVATMPTGLANIRVGAGISIALPSFAYHSRFAMFNSALSAANLDLVTA
jgi:hypothetical protein